MFELLGITLFLAGLLSINSLSAFAVEAFCRLTSGFRRGWSNQFHARFLFVARVLPFSISISLLLLLLAPAYIAYEPRHTTEEISFKLGFLALLSATGILLTIWRGVSSWRATRNLSRQWLTNAQPIEMDGVAIPSYRFSHPFPVIAVVGALRPRLFIADQVWSSLTESELKAAVAHENAHLASRDNLKRGLLRGCRNMLGIIPCGRSLDLAWAEISEIAADELASSRGRNVALDLASALVKVARLVPPGTTPRMPAGAFLIDGTDSPGISSRVGRLLQHPNGDFETRIGWSLGNFLVPALVVMILSMLVFGMTSTSLLSVVHSFTERFVDLLM